MHSIAQRTRNQNPCGFTACILDQLPNPMRFGIAGKATSDTSGTSTESTDTATMRHTMNEGPAGTHSNPIPSAVLSKPGWNIPPQIQTQSQIQAPPQIQALQQSGTPHSFSALLPPPSAPTTQDPGKRGLAADTATV